MHACSTNGKLRWSQREATTGWMLLAIPGGILELFDCIFSTTFTKMIFIESGQNVTALETATAYSILTFCAAGRFLWRNDLETQCSLGLLCAPSPSPQFSIAFQVILLLNTRSRVTAALHGPQMEPDPNFLPSHSKCIQRWPSGLT
jgi:hypothetical protein